MEAKRVEIPAKDTFKPFKIEITFESREEAEAMYAIFNNSHILDAAKTIGGIDSDKIREAIGDKYDVPLAEWDKFVKRINGVT